MKQSVSTNIILFTLVLSKGVCISTAPTDPSLAGMPLSDDEYEKFFRVLNSPHRVSAVCSLRALYGCQNSLIQTLDQYENHGVIPEGRVCSDLAEGSTFPDFCALTFYRCTLKKYFVKRVLCPGESSTMSTEAQTVKQKVEIDNIILSSTFKLDGTMNAASTVKAEPPSEVPPTTATPSGAATEASTEHLVTSPATATTEPMIPLLEDFPEDSSTLTSTTNENDFSLPLPADSSQEPVASTPTTTATESVPELLATTPSATSTATEAAFILPTTTAAETTTESTSQPSLEDLTESAAASINTTESLLDLFSPTKIYPELPMPTVTETTESSPQLSESLSDSTSQEPTTELSTSAATTPTSSTTGVSPEEITDTAQSATTASSSTETSAGTTPVPAEAVSAASLIAAAASTPSLIGTILASIFSTNAEPLKQTPSLSSAPTASPQLFLQIPAFFLQHPPLSNASVQVFIISADMHGEQASTEAVTEIITSLPQTTTKPSMEEEQEESSSPPPSLFPVTSSHPLSSRLWDHRVQRLIQELQQLLLPGKEIPKRQLAATSLELLRALNHEKMKKKAKQLLGLKIKFQR